MSQKGLHNMERSSLSTAQLGLGIALSVGIVASTWIYIYTTISARHTITVKGYAEKAVVAEQGRWSGTITVRHNRLEDAYKEMNEHLASVQEFVVEAGFEAGSLEKTHQSHHPIYKKTPDGQNTTNEIDVYEVSQGVSIKSTDVKAVKNLANQISRLNEQGCNIAANEPAYYYPSDKLELIKLQMIAEATQNGHQRATQFAINSGSRVSRLVSAHQGLFQVAAPYSTTSDYDRYDTSSIDKVVKLVVTLTYNVS